MKVSVTGANGFIGQAIVAELFENSHEIVAIGRGNSVNQTFVKTKNYFRTDISSAENFAEIEQMRNVEIFIHCAGLAHQFGKVGKSDFWKTNVVGTENVANLGVKLKIKHFILISSVAVYGGNFENKNPVNEEFICQPKDFYAESKLESERIAKEICQRNKIALTILRPVTVIGEGDRGNFLRLISAIDRKRFVWIGNGTNQKSLIHKTDVARVCLQVLDKKTVATEIFNISGKPLSMKEIVDEIGFGLNRKIPKVSVPTNLLQSIFSVNSRTLKLKKIQKLSETVRKWTAEDVYSAEKLKNVHGFEAKITVREAISREVNWYLTHKKNV